MTAYNRNDWGTTMWTLDVDIANARSDAPRSVGITLVNNTSKTLYWDDSGLEHGKRKITAPDDIAPQKKGRWMLESDGYLTGCEGWMNWRVGEGGPKLKLEYDIPYAGSNEYGYEVEASDVGYTVEKRGGSGNRANVVFVISEVVNQIVGALPLAISSLASDPLAISRRG
ncbi:hypothetical protein FANTH_5626 [Fusarium anthophilum]|uniref:Uncharacterized protein n=1 Tax=Fusarium anthophilum TaxID=48485 RepID=A0A8H5E6I5_9HYPO|nr:hypothetical protein FANTH_5626 [Fusarium anthophilum]